MTANDDGRETRQAAPSRPRWRRWLRAACYVVGFGFGVYVLIIALLMLYENYLIFPAPKYPSGDWQPASLAFEDVFFKSRDGTRLHGWYVAHPAPKAYVLYCHGNGEHVAHSAGLLAAYRDDLQLSVLAFDYRGYGRSDGNPFEQGVLEDGDAAQRWLAERAGIGIDEVVLVGRSLGGAVAVDLAANNGARGLVLERTFSSMPDVAARHYPILPVRMVIRTQLNSAAKIQRFDGPILQSHGTADNVVPFALGRKLFAAAVSRRKEFIIEKGYSHNDGYSPEYWNKLREFLWNLDSR